MQNLDINTIIQLIAVSAIPVLFAIALHEVAHGWVANKLGDPTAANLGRLSINPLKHIDPIGTVIVPILLIITVGFAFGWAKPVPVDWRNLHNPKRDMIYVAAAGPLANLLMALFWGLIFKLATLFSAIQFIAVPMALMAQVGVMINTVLFVFNLFPIPPLDGGRVAVGLLPNNLATPLARIEPFGFFILIALMLSGLLWKIIGPVVDVVSSIIYLLTGF